MKKILEGKKKKSKQTLDPLLAMGGCFFSQVL